ncbi:MAG: hypothetical protein A3F72_17920 [Bacteroidetes bacterium RIFCSPLOWO2_12_FULL_35_15]|nr:MAG: hypothetical protein A3F72_17920 [Bacteroidetes bacterium RIFCSPLOWO2_12_FULL_35_15]
MQLQAQLSSRENKKLMLKADNSFDYGDYLTALKIYNKMYIVDSTNNDLNYKLGISDFEIKKFRNESKKYFEKLPVSSYPESNYYLGRLYHLSRDYNKAISCFSQYKKYKGEKEHTEKELDDLIDKSNTAMLFEASADNTIRIENIGNAVNTEYSEYVPLISAEENFMIFTSRRKNGVWQEKDPLGDYFEDIYVAKRVGNIWQTPKMLDSSINTAVHDACTGLSADGEKLLIYRTSKDLRSGDIYESFLTHEKWSQPTMLGSNVNSANYSETSACYSPDGDIIFFSSNRPGGFGGKDLYSVKKLPNEKWAEPFNLGPNINTEYNEDAPFVHPTGNILFFSSEGHKNIGGYDVFKSNFDEEGGFSTPENLGYPVNTSDDDIFFVLNTSASKGYLSSERAGGYGSQDIYQVNFSANTLPLNVYNICVFDDSDTLINKVEIALTDLAAMKLFGVYKSNPRTGKILIIAEADKEYQITIKSNGFEPFITNSVFNTDNYITYKMIRKKE